MKTLVVGSDGAFPSLVRSALARRGEDVVVAGTIHEACGVLQGESFWLVAWGTAEPGGDGEACVRRLRAACEGHTVAILVGVASGHAGHLRSLLAAGADDYLVEPYESDRVDARLAVLENRFRLLAESEARYRLIAENASDLIWTSRLDGINELPSAMAPEDAFRYAEELMSRWRFTYLSPSVERILGYAPDELVNGGLGRMLTPEAYRVAVQALAEELLAERQPGADPHRQRCLELAHVDSQGSVRWCEVLASFQRDPQGRIEGLLGVSREVTERRAAESALAERERTLRGLIENIPDMLIVVNSAGMIQFASRGVKGLSPRDLAGKSGFGFMIPEHQPLCQQSLDEALRTGQVQHVEVADVFGLWWSCRVVPMIDAPEIRNAMVICTDVTQRRQSERAIRQEQDLLRRLLELHERDRQLLAFELHDGFAQLLAGAMFNLQAFRQSHRRKPKAAWSMFDTALRLVSQSLEEARRLVAGLCPTDLEQFGIVPAVENMISQRNEAGGPKVEFVCRGRLPRLPRPLENAVFRIAQESVANACRHSRSDRVRVELSRDEQEVGILVEDWGVGFDPQHVGESCFGLRGIRERTRLFGGSMTLDTAPGKGTRILVKLPLSLQEDNEA